jgi:hypothetical protein
MLANGKRIRKPFPRQTDAQFAPLDNNGPFRLTQRKKAL